jgi:hypothetical protein
MIAPLTESEYGDDPTTESESGDAPTHITTADA